jgi:hypothetical protein
MRCQLEELENKSPKLFVLGWVLDEAADRERRDFGIALVPLVRTGTGVPVPVGCSLPTST